MNAFQQHASAPPTEAEYIARQDEIVRTEERRLFASDLAFEYSRHDGFVRYSVAAEDLCCALAGLDAVYEIAGVVR
jgi:hypothetical protein